MAISFRHAFTSGKVDGTDSTLIQPSNWNAEHTLTLAAGKVLGRDSSAGGAAQELAISVDPTQQSMIPPSGATSARPATAIAGMLRYNTSLSAFEGFMGSVWSSFVGVASDNTFTGSNTFSTTGASYRLRITSGSGNGKYVVYQTNGSTRWEVGSGSTAETGSNAGSSFQISRYDDSGTFIDTPLVISRQSGSVGLNSGSYAGGSTGPGSFYVSGGAANNRSYYLSTNFSTRWQIRADSTSESGSNAGSNFSISRYDDAGNFVASPLAINRATGLTTLESLSVPSIDLGSSDTTITRVSGGLIAVEGQTIPTLSRSNTWTASNSFGGTSFTVTSTTGITSTGVKAGYVSINNLSGYFSYDTGVTATQATSKTTSVFCAAHSGRITMNSAALAAGDTVLMPVISSCAEKDTVMVSVQRSSIANAGTYRVFVDSVSNNTFTISVTNISTGSLSEALVINFTIIGGF